MKSVLEKFSLVGRSALVTGGSSGIGLACVEVLAEAGASVTIAGNHAEHSQQQAQRLCDMGFDVRAWQVDVSKEDEVRAAFDEHMRHYGRLDIVFANAGISAGKGYLNGQGERHAQGQIENFDVENWHAAIDVNLGGVYFTIRHAARVMKPTGRPGSIVVTTSNASTITVPVVAAPYMAAKAGAAHLVRQLARELAHFGIRVNAIAPGSIITNIGGGSFHKPEVRDAWAKGVPLGGKMGLPDQIKPLALYLASDASDFVTGTEILIDGGVSLTGFQ